MSNNNYKKIILDRRSYDAKTISTYNVIGAYVVDIYYNYLFAEAKKMKNSNKVASITEGYRHAVFAFISAIDNKSKSYKPRHYENLLIGINNYFTKWTSMTTLTLFDCIDRITCEFIPTDYYKSLNRDQKRNILRIILTNSIREFSKCVVTEYLNHIIDNHDEPANVEALKNKIVDILILERESFYQKFLDSNIGKTDKIDKGIVEKMQAENRTLNNENAELKNRNKTMESEIRVRIQQLQQLLDKYKLLNKKYQGATEELEKIKASRFNNNTTMAHSLPIVLHNNPAYNNPVDDETDSENDYIPEKELASQSIQEPIQEPVKEPVKELVKESVKESVQEKPPKSNKSNKNNTKSVKLPPKKSTKSNIEVNSEDNSDNKTAKKKIDESDNFDLQHKEKIEEEQKINTIIDDKLNKANTSVKLIGMMGEEPSLNDIY